MPKFTFTCEHEDVFGEVQSTVQHQFYAEAIGDVLSDFTASCVAVDIDLMVK